jgi:cellulose synthase/poly-beta-1,6-N-acetylglucosamine synthase-like glycosyltransferase
MVVLEDPLYDINSTSVIAAPEPGSPRASHVPAQDNCTAIDSRLIASTILALAAAVVFGLVAHYAMRYLNRVILPRPTRTNPPVWVHWVLLVGYWLFVGTVVAPFFTVTAWSMLGRRRFRGGPLPALPMVSILIPAYNEQEIILDAIAAALNQNYREFEVIVIDDGSRDLTAHLAATTGARLIRHERNQGKAAALNTGIAAARGEFIVTSDADGYLDAHALAHLIPHFADATIGAVAGQVRLFHPRGALRAFQVLEYAYCQSVVKEAQFATAGSVTVAPGPVSAFRTDLLRQMGGISADTLTEDFDLTLAIVDHGARIVYEPRAVAYTEAPATDAELRRQRIRWGRGGLQVFWKYRRLMGKSQLKFFGTFWLPYSLFSWYAPAPLALFGALLLPLLAWSSGEPVRFLESLALYGLPIVAIELARVATGVALSHKRDLRFLIFAPLYLVYQKVRLDWFSLEALWYEWRHRPKTWNE